MNVSVPVARFSEKHRDSEVFRKKAGLAGMPLFMRLGATDEVSGCGGRI